MQRRAYGEPKIGRSPIINAVNDFFCKDIMKNSYAATFLQEWQDNPESLPKALKLLFIQNNNRVVFISANAILHQIWKYWLTFNDNLPPRIFQKLVSRLISVQKLKPNEISPIIKSLAAICVRFIDLIDCWPEVPAQFRIDFFIDLFQMCTPDNSYWSNPAHQRLMELTPVFVSTLTSSPITSSWVSLFFVSVDCCINVSSHLTLIGKLESAALNPEFDSLFSNYSDIVLIQYDPAYGIFYEGFINCLLIILRRLFSPIVFESDPEHSLSLGIVFLQAITDFSPPFYCDIRRHTFTENVLTVVLDCLSRYADFPDDLSLVLGNLGHMFGEFLELDMTHALVGESTVVVEEEEEEEEEVAEHHVYEQPEDDFFDIQHDNDMDMYAFDQMDLDAIPDFAQVPAPKKTKKRTKPKVPEPDLEPKPPVFDPSKFSQLTYGYRASLPPSLDSTPEPDLPNYSDAEAQVDVEFDIVSLPPFISQAVQVDLDRPSSKFVTAGVQSEFPTTSCFDTDAQMKDAGVQFPPPPPVHEHVPMYNSAFFPIYSFVLGIIVDIFDSHPNDEQYRNEQIGAAFEAISQTGGEFLMSFIRTRDPSQGLFLALSYCSFNFLKEYGAILYPNSPTDSFAFLSRFVEVAPSKFPNAVSCITEFRPTVETAMALSVCISTAPWQVLGNDHIIAIIINWLQFDIGKYLVMAVLELASLAPPELQSHLYSQIIDVAALRQPFDFQLLMDLMNETSSPDKPIYLQGFVHDLFDSLLNSMPWFEDDSQTQSDMCNIVSCATDAYWISDFVPIISWLEQIIFICPVIEHVVLISKINNCWGNPPIVNFILNIGNCWEVDLLSQTIVLLEQLITNRWEPFMDTFPLQFLISMLSTNYSRTQENAVSMLTALMATCNDINISGPCTDAILGAAISTFGEPQIVFAIRSLHRLCSTGTYPPFIVSTALHNVLPFPCQEADDFIELFCEVPETEEQISELIMCALRMVAHIKYPMNFS